MNTKKKNTDRKDNQIYAQCFGALANSLRISIVLLLRTGRKNVSELTAGLGADQSAVSHSLRKLVSSGFVKVEKIGAFRYYSLNTVGAEGLINAVELHSTIVGGFTLHASGTDKYCKMLDTLPVALMIYIKEDVVYANRCAARLYGVRDAKKLIGRKVSQLIDKESYDRVKPRIMAMMSGKKYPIVVKERVYRVDGSMFLADVAATPLLFRGQPAIQVLVYPHISHDALRYE